MKLLSCLAAALLVASLSFAQNAAPASAPPQTPTAQSDENDPVKQGRKLSQEGKQDEALALFKQAVEANPRNFDAYNGGGIALDLKGDYAAAQHHFAKAIEIATPEQKPQAMRQMAFSYAFERKPADAAKFEQPLFDTRLAGN